jgi:hypothetical protein
LDLETSTKKQTNNNNQEHKQQNKRCIQPKRLSSPFPQCRCCPRWLLDFPPPPPSLHTNDFSQLHVFSRVNILTFPTDSQQKTKTNHCIFSFFRCFADPDPPLCTASVCFRCRGHRRSSPFMLLRLPVSPSAASRSPFISGPPSCAFSTLLPSCPAVARRNRAWGYCRGVPDGC